MGSGWRSCGTSACACDRSADRSSGSGSSAAWPVSDRNTSSSVGSRNASEAGSSPSRSSARTTSIATARAVVRPSTRRCDRRVRRRTSPACRAAPRARCALAASLEADLDDGRAEPGLELGRRALGDHVPVVDDDDVVGEAVGFLEVLRRQEQRSCRRATSSSITRQRSVRPCGSRPVVGSSRKSTAGRCTSAAARSRRRRMPPL